MAISAATVGGLNVPQAAGQETPGPVAAKAPRPEPVRLEAGAVQQLLEQRDTQRATRNHMRVVAADLKARRAAQRKAAQERAARIARERARPKFMTPVADFRMSASFGASGGLWSNGHTGQDFAADWGTVVRAAADGVIISAEYDGAYGKKIIIEHADGTQTWYCHLASYAQTGGKVQAGEPIGAVGITGNTTGPHLHFEVREGDVPINPVKWLRSHGVSI